MNELEEYDGATLEKAIHALDNEQLISDINKIAEDNNCKISICHHKDDQKRDKIYFCAELIDANKTPDTVKIGARIYELAHYYENISVNLKSEYSPENFARLFENVTLFTPENYSTIHEFFKKHYPEYYSTSSQNVVHQDKKRRSVSPSSIFSQKESSQRVEPEAADKIVEHLKGSPLWEEIKRSPEVLDEAFRRAKSAIRAEQASSIRPPGVAT